MSFKESLCMCGGVILVYQQKGYILGKNIPEKDFLNFSYKKKMGGEIKILYAIDINTNSIIFTNKDLRKGN